MALTADSLLERMQLKTQVSRWRLLAIAAFALLLVMLLAPREDSVSSGLPVIGDAIVRIEVSDVITRDRAREEKLQELAERENVKAVILHIDSPGGTIVGGETLYYSIQKLAQAKPVVVVMGSVAASGGYMAALPAGHIVAHEGTLTGSIGVILQSAEFTGMAEKLGVKLLTFKSGDLKATPSPFEKLTPVARKAAMDSIRSGHDMFVRMVAESRDMQLSKVRKLADGRIYTGAQALEYGLIDAIGGEEKALNWLYLEQNVDKSLPIKDFSLKYKKNQFDELYTRIMGGETLSALLNSKQGLMAIWRMGI